MAASKEKSKMKIGEILLAEGLITDDQLKEALTEQKRNGANLPLGEVCVNLKFISRSDLRKTLRTHQKNIQLGELLINMGLITNEQLEEALHHREITDKKFGSILIDLGYISEGALVEALSIQLGYPKMIPSMALVDRSLWEGLSAAFLKKNKVLPVFKEGNTVTVIMANPLDEEVLDGLKRHLRCDIEPTVAASEEIVKTIDMYFKGVGGEYAREEKDLVVGDTILSGRTDDSIIEILNFILTHAVMEEASDIHICPQESKTMVQYRVDGMLHHKTDIPKHLTPSLTSRIKVLCGLDITERRKHQDGRIEAKVLNKNIDMRISTYASRWGENVVIRLLARQSGLIDVDMLGFSPYHLSMFKRIMDTPSGIILVTGPTGSGKTTTLYAAIAYMLEQNKKIITAEDPIEYTIDGVVQGQIDHRLKQTYTDFLKSMLRQDPEVMMIGEIRDHIAAEAVVQAALTGHKVLSTFHTEDTTGALLRLLDMGIETFLISSTVVSVISQRLVRLLCPKCKVPYEPDETTLSQFPQVQYSPLEEYNSFHGPKGCHYCRYTGYKGRTSIQEILMVNDVLRTAILKRGTSHQIRAVARKGGGLVSMREDGFCKASKGITSLEDVMRVSVLNDIDAEAPRQFKDLVAISEMKDRKV